MPLHPIDEDITVRKQRINQDLIMEENLKRLLLKSFTVSGKFKPLLNSDLGFVDFTMNKIP